MKGDRNGESLDLKNSNSLTTFILMDGTRVTFNATDYGVIENVDIISGSQHVHGNGQASESWSKSELFTPQVLTDGTTPNFDISRGDAVFVGGDGNDWFTASGLLVWGHSNLPSNNIPSSLNLELIIKQTVMEILSIHRVEKSI
jgi:hypothetical protein